MREQNRKLEEKEKAEGYSFQDSHDRFVQGLVDAYNSEK